MMYRNTGRLATFTQETPSVWRRMFKARLVIISLSSLLFSHVVAHLLVHSFDWQFIDLDGRPLSPYLSVMAYTAFGVVVWPAAIFLFALVPHELRRILRRRRAMSCRAKSSAV